MILALLSLSVTSIASPVQLARRGKPHMDKANFPNSNLTIKCTSNLNRAIRKIHPILTVRHPIGLRPEHQSHRPKFDLRLWQLSTRSSRQHNRNRHIPQ